MPKPHQPVLLAKTLEYLAPKPGQIYLDLTAGFGGHAQAVQAWLGKSGQLILVDRDQVAIKWLTSHFKTATIYHSDFVSAAHQLADEGSQVDMILLDLGTSSPQLENPNRGFSIARDGPLDMRMDQRQSLTAAQIVNQASERDLADILGRLGEARFGRRIARVLTHKRPFQSTAQLAATIAGAMPPQFSRGRIHPATRSFQAIRMAVNQELDQLAQVLPLLNQLVVPGGRVVVISFHSLEDRLVKHFFKGQPDQWQILTKKPVLGKIEDVTNPRARSAKLRAAIKN